MWQELGKNKTLRSGAWLRKSRFVARRGHRGHLFKLREEQAEIQKKRHEVTQKVPRYSFLFSINCRATFFRKLMESSSED